MNNRTRMDQGQEMKERQGEKERRQVKDSEGKGGESKERIRTEKETIRNEGKTKHTGGEGCTANIVVDRRCHPKR